MARSIAGGVATPQAIGERCRQILANREVLATLRRIEEMGCDEAQGWLLSRAEPAATLTPWLLDRHAEQVALHR